MGCDRNPTCIDRSMVMSWFREGLANSSKAIQVIGRILNPLASHPDFWSFDGHLNTFQTHSPKSWPDKKSLSGRLFRCFFGDNTKTVMITSYLKIHMINILWLTFTFFFYFSFCNVIATSALFLVMLKSSGRCLGSVVWPALRTPIPGL